MNKFLQSKIYTIRSHQTDDIYIGSTTQLLCKRLSNHKNTYKHYLAGKYHNVTSYKIIKYEDCYIELLEAFPCETKEQLHKREGELIRSHKCVNKCIPGRIQSEYYQNNIETIKEKQSEKHSCQCGGKFTTSSKSRHIKSLKHQNYLGIQVSVQDS
jgi:hypothetical protein